MNCLIVKYEVKYSGEFKISVQEDSKILSAKEIKGKIQINFKVDPAKKIIERHFEIQKYWKVLENSTKLILVPIKNGIRNLPESILINYDSKKKSIVENEDSEFKIIFGFEKYYFKHRGEIFGISENEKEIIRSKDGLNWYKYKLVED